MSYRLYKSVQMQAVFFKFEIGPAQLSELQSSLTDFGSAVG